MLIDGEVDYACTTRLHEGEMTLPPLPKKTLISDLVTEIAPPDERLKSRRSDWVSQYRHCERTEAIQEC